MLLFRSPYLLLIALFLLLMTWISTIVYFQLGDLITKAFDSKEARTQAYATIDLAVNSLAVLMQLFGTGRIIQRFGVQTGLLLNPIIMVIAFLAVAFSPVLMILGGIQIVRRVAEYAVAKPTRDMLFTVVDQESKYKAKNVIDTVVYRFGDFSSAWVSAAVLPYRRDGTRRLRRHHFRPVVPDRLCAREALRERAQRRSGRRGRRQPRPQATADSTLRVIAVRSSPMAAMISSACAKRSARFFATSLWRKSS